MKKIISVLASFTLIFSMVAPIITNSASGDLIVSPVTCGEGEISFTITNGGYKTITGYTVYRQSPYEEVIPFESVVLSPSDSQRIVLNENCGDFALNVEYSSGDTEVRSISCPCPSDETEIEDEIETEDGIETVEPVETVEPTNDPSDNGDSDEEIIESNPDVTVEGRCDGENAIFTITNHSAERVVTYFRIIRTTSDDAYVEEAYRGDLTLAPGAHYETRITNPNCDKLVLRIGRLASYNGQNHIEMMF